MRRLTVVRHLLLLFAVVAAFAIAFPRAQTPAVPAPDPAREQRLEWFREAKYGLFIHWGLYAIPAGEWKGQRIPGIGEWIMNRARIPVKEYELLAKQFNPVRFNADEWVQLAKDAGMKYIVITSKHHDGFALYDSKVTTWDVVDATPFKRDILRELQAACRKAGMRLGFYYSQSQDWHHPGGAGNNWDYPSNDEKHKSGAFDTYLREKAEPQVRELLTEYGPVALIWFDTPQLMDVRNAEMKHRAPRFTDLVRSLAPATLIDGRLGEEGDYISTGDNVIPPEIQKRAWEVPATINHTWGYRKDDQDWKSPGQILFKLIDIVSKGGNYLLNVGPMADGIIPQASQDTLRTVGRWLKVNGDAVYGARPSPWGDELGEFSSRGAKNLRNEPLFLLQTDWRVTEKPGKLFITFFTEPRTAFPLPKMTNAVTRAYRLDGGVPIELKTGGGVTTISVPRPIWDPMATVVVVEYDGARVDKQ